MISRQLPRPSKVISSSNGTLHKLPPCCKGNGGNYLHINAKRHNDAQLHRTSIKARSLDGADAHCQSAACLRGHATVPLRDICTLRTLMLQMSNLSAWTGPPGTGVLCTAAACHCPIPAHLLQTCSLTTGWAHVPEASRRPAKGCCLRYLSPLVLLTTSG